LVTPRLLPVTCLFASLLLSSCGLSDAEERYAAQVESNTGLTQETALQAAEDYCEDKEPESIDYLDGGDQLAVVAAILRHDLC
jgi:hypothetical protein